MNEKRLAQIAKRIDRIKEELQALGPMRPGSLTRQYKDPHSRSGPYHQLSYTRDMKSRTDYIARDNVPEVRRLIGNYKRFKALTTQWVDLSIEHSQLEMKLARNA
jgi:hypothetical protein